MAAYEDWIPLDPEIFHKLDACDPSFSWELLKNEVCKNLLGDLPIPIPFLDEAYCWEPFAVVCKNQGTMRLAGSLIDCLDPVIDSSDLKVAPREQTQYHIQPKITLKYSNLIGGVRKGVKITLENCKAYEVAVSVRKGDLMLDMFNPLFQDINRVYVAHEIFYVDLVRVSCTIGVSKRNGKYQEVENKRFEHRGRTPIAFVCDKFPINERGVIGERLRTEGNMLRYGKWRRMGSTRKQGKNPRVPKTENKNEKPLFPF